MRACLLLVAFIGYAFADCDLTVGVPASGSWDVACNNTLLDGSTCNFICNSGFTGGGSATCTGTTVSAPPACLANCGQPVHPSPTAGVETYASTCNGTASGSSCPVTCATPHYTAGAAAVCTDGVWSYTGSVCAADPVDCDSAQCNGGVCQDTTGTQYDGLYTCDCSALSPLKSGATCLTQLPDCQQPTATNNGVALQACQNGGTCQSGANSTDLLYTCQCASAAFIGDHCETAVGDCANPASTIGGATVGAGPVCSNGGACVDGTANDLTVTCDCSGVAAPGATGNRCQYRRCAGLAVPSAGTYSCGTAAQNSGVSCQITCTAGNFLSTANNFTTCNDGVWSTQPVCSTNIVGCMDSSKCNYNANANVAGTCYEDCTPGSWSAWTLCDASCGQTGIQTRTCGAVAGQMPCPSGPSSQSCVRQCCSECQNCSWWYGSFTPCTRQCGRFGRRWREIILDRPADPNAIIQCPAGIYQNLSCNTNMCRHEIRGRGFYSWRVCGPANFTWTVGSLTGQNLDTFLFKEGYDFDGYRKDVGRILKPLNYGYGAVASDLATENAQGRYTLRPDTCYHFVVDYTNVGENVDDLIREDRPLIFTYELLGNPADPLDGEPGEWGFGERSAALTATPVLALFVSLFGLLALWR